MKLPVWLRIGEVVLPPGVSVGCGSATLSAPAGRQLRVRGRFLRRLYVDSVPIVPERALGEQG